MNFGDDIQQQYFEWLCSLIDISSLPYTRLLRYLNRTRFTYLIPKDQNREEDGLDLRFRFKRNVRDDLTVDYILDWQADIPCSVLEMMIALSLRAEEQIMDDPEIGDRTTQWFWGMISNLGLSGMYDGNFDLVMVKWNVNRFLNREYSPDGRGGLFTVKNCEYDLRDVEIWTQLCWYLDKFV